MSHTPAPNLQAYLRSNVIGWLRGLFKQCHLPTSPLFGKAIGSREFNIILMHSIMDYYNRTDEWLEQQNDAYVVKSFDNMRTEFGGMLPCMFLELIASTSLTVAKNITQSDAVKAAKTVEEIDILVHLCFDVYWHTSLRERLYTAIHDSLKGCKNTAKSAKECCMTPKKTGEKRFVLVTDEQKAPKNGHSIGRFAV